MKEGWPLPSLCSGARLPGLLCHRIRLVWPWKRSRTGEKRQSLQPLNTHTLVRPEHLPCSSGSDQLATLPLSLLFVVFNSEFILSSSLPGTVLMFSFCFFDVLFQVLCFISTTVAVLATWSFFQLSDSEHLFMGLPVC